MTTTYESTPPLSLAEAEDDQEACRQWHALNAYITDGALRQWELRYKDSTERVLKDCTAFDFRGDAAVIIGGRAPHKPSSSGKVWTSDNGEYYPSVFGMEWVNTLG